MEHEHSPDAIRRRLESGPTHNYLRDWIYGAIDGSVTTLAVVTGVAGAQLSKWIILALGFANLFADGFSMAASNYLGTKAEHDDRRRLEQIEYRHICGGQGRFLISSIAASLHADPSTANRIFIFVLLLCRLLEHDRSFIQRDRTEDSNSFQILKLFS